MTDITRRTFLETGTALAGTAALAARAMAQPQVTIPASPVPGASRRRVLVAPAAWRGLKAVVVQVRW